MRILFLLLFSLSFFSCTKEGPTGPAGNASVKTLLVNVIAADWQYDSVSAVAEKPVAEITSDIYNKGSVNVYWHVNNEWFALPFTFPAGSTARNMGFSYKAGSLKIIVTDSNGTAPSGLNTATYKVVITAGN